MDWVSVQRAIGSVLPVDYKHLVEITRPLCAGDFLTVFAPGVENPNIDLFVQVGARLGALQVLKRDGGAREVPYPLWFEPGGLLPWGSSDNGDTLFWLTRGHPDQWTVVVGEGRGPTYAEYPIPASDFLVEFLSGHLESRVLPSAAAVAGGDATVRQLQRSRPA
jgi:hypothetical protein